MTYNEYVHILSNSEEFNKKEFIIDIELSDAELIKPFYDEVEMLSLHSLWGKAFHGRVMFSDDKNKSNDNRLYTDSFGVYFDIASLYGEKNINAKFRVLAEYVYEYEDTHYLEYGITFETENYGFKIKKLICDIDKPETVFTHTRIEEAVKYIDKLFTFPKMLPSTDKNERNYGSYDIRMKSFTDNKINSSVNEDVFKDHRTEKSHTYEELVLELYLIMRKMK